MKMPSTDLTVLENLRAHSGKCSKAAGGIDCSKSL